MKHFLILLCILLCLSAFKSFSQCTLSLHPYPSGVCKGDSVTLTLDPPRYNNNLITTTAAGNNHRGNMFEITALTDIVIDSFDVYPMQNTIIEVYYKVGPMFRSITNLVHGLWWVVDQLITVAMDWCVYLCILMFLFLRILPIVFM